MSLFNILKRKKNDNLEARRCEFLLAHGRITEGRIIDSEISENGAEIVFYLYNIQGVDFESSEILSDDKLRDPLKYAPGAKVGVRYDPKNHGNSMLV